MAEDDFDLTGVFDDDYLHFFGDELNAHCDDEAELIRRLLELAPGMDVLDLPCGFGRISGRLAALGCRVTGVDAMPSLLERARRDAAARGVTVDYVEGDMRRLPWTERFDRVVMWFSSFGYFDDADNRRVLGETARVLRPGGRFLVETLNRDWLLRHFQHASVVHRDGDRIVDEHRFEPLTGRVVTDRTVIRGGGTRTVRYFVRQFTFTELRDWLLDAGFTEVDGYDEYGDPLGPDSQRMIVVAGR
jgi:ubiquinone/menaquinone biosynthesis C-methylase UbiE